METCRIALLAGATMFLVSCAGGEPTRDEIASLGHFATLASGAATRGVVVAVPGIESGSLARAARAVHERDGAAVVVAEGYAAHAIAVNAPYEGRAGNYGGLQHTPRALGVYREYVRALREAAGGRLGLYIELRESGEGSIVQVATVGVSAAEASRIKAIPFGHSTAQVEPVDKLAFDPWGTRNNGILLIPPKGLSVLVPAGLARPEDVAKWLHAAIAALSPVGIEPAGRAPVMDRGRFIAKKRSSGIVIAAPHGSGDRYTDEMAARIAERLGASLLVAHGFMGTHERANADRIAVNRPLEGAGFDSTDRATPDAATVYAAYVEEVKALAPWPPRLYVEIHCNDLPPARGAIEVATVGVPAQAARRIKEAYAEAAARAKRSGVVMRIEGVDSVYMNAFGNKRVGIMGSVPVAVHFEFPAAVVLADAQTRATYADIVAETLRSALPVPAPGEGLPAR